MRTCIKCGRELADNDLIYWKCTKCGKVFNASLAKLKNLWKQKQERSGQALLKCPECGYGIDDGNEMLAYKCPGCGNADRGNLENFAGESHDIKNVSIDVVPTNNLIRCPDCGKQISLNADTCPNCGHPFRKKKKYFKRILLTAFSLLVVSLIICGGILYGIDQSNKHHEKINNIIKEIELFTKKDIPTQEEYYNIMKLCDGLTEKEKEEVTNISNLEKFKGIDLETLNILSERIESVGDNTSFSDLIGIENEYNKLSLSEQNLLDISLVFDKKNMIKIEQDAKDYLDKAALSCKDVMYTIYNSWLYQVSFQLDDYKRSGKILEPYTSEVDIPASEVKRIVKELSGKSDDIAIIACVSTLEFNLGIVHIYYEEKGTFKKINNNLKKSKKYINKLNKQSKKKKKLQKYYNAVNKYYKFVNDPACSFMQLKDIEISLDKEVEDCKNDLSWE